MNELFKPKGTKVAKSHTDKVFGERGGTPEILTQKSTAIAGSRTTL